MVIRLGKKPNNRIGVAENAVDQQQVFWLLLLGVAYLLRDIVMLPMPDIVFTGLCGMAFLFLSTGSAMGIYMFTSALTVPDFEIRIVYLAVLLAKFWLKNKKFRASVLLLVLGMALLELTNIMLFSNQQIMGVLYKAVMRLTYFVLPLFWVSEDFSPEDYRRTLLCYVAGVILGGSVILYMSVDAVGWRGLLEDANMRLGMNTTDSYVTQSQIQTGYNANQLGGMFAIVISIAIAMMDQKYITKIFGVLLGAFSVFVVVLTKSRTAVLLVLGIVAVYYFYMLFRRKKMMSGMLFLLAALVLTYGVVVCFPWVVDGLISRFMDKDNLTGGRSELFVEYIEAWLDNLWVFLFGYGIVSYPETVGIPIVPHNILTDIAISWGLTGILFVVCTWGILYEWSCRGSKKDTRLLAYLPALTAFAAGLAGQYLSTGFPHMRLCFLLLAAKAFSDTPNDERHEERVIGR